MFSDPLGKIRKAAAICKIPEKLPDFSGRGHNVLNGRIDHCCRKDG